MRVFRPVIEVPVRAVFHAGPHLPLRGRIAFQPGGDDDSRDVPTGFEQLPKELFGGCVVAATLSQNIENMASLIARPPEVVPFPMKREKDLIERPLVPSPGTMAPELMGIPLAELPAPLSDRLRGHGNPACKEQFFHIAVAEAEPLGEPYAVADHVCGKAVMFVSVGRSGGVHAAIMSHAPEIGETPGLS
jgi:hypothetical protein